MRAGIGQKRGRQGRNDGGTVIADNAQGLTSQGDGWQACAEIAAENENPLLHIVDVDGCDGRFLRSAGTRRSAIRRGCQQEKGRESENFGISVD
jgi:hypothetical protein